MANDPLSKSIPRIFRLFITSVGGQCVNEDCFCWMPNEDPGVEAIKWSPFGFSRHQIWLLSVSAWPMRSPFGFDRSQSPKLRVLSVWFFVNFVIKKVSKGLRGNEKGCHIYLLYMMYTIYAETRKDKEPNLASTETEWTHFVPRSSIGTRQKESMFTHRRELTLLMRIKNVNQKNPLLCVCWVWKKQKWKYFFSRVIFPFLRTGAGIIASS